MKNRKKKTKCPEREEKEDTTFPASPDPTANMHCDKRQGKKGMVEGKSHNAYHYGIEQKGDKK